MKQIGLLEHDFHRRDMLRLAGAAAAAALSWPAAAQTSAVEVLVPNAMMSGKLRQIVEQDTGIKINDAPFQSTPDTIARLLAPGGTTRYNVMLGLTDFARKPVLGQHAGDEKALVLDPAKIPNAAKIADIFKKETFERDGKIYGLPVLMGYNTVLFDYDKVPADDPYTQSWGAIFEDKYAGKIGWFENAHQMIFAAALYLGKQQPSSMSDAEVSEVGDFMISKKKNVRTIWTSFAQCANLFATGEVVTAFGPIPVRAQLEQQGVHVTNAWVKEGVESFVAALFSGKDVTNPDASQAVINAMLSDAYAKELPKVSGYLSASAAGGEGMTDQQKLQAGYGIYTGETKHQPMPIPANLNTWVEVWSRVKSA